MSLAARSEVAYGLEVIDAVSEMLPGFWWDKAVAIGTRGRSGRILGGIVLHDWKPWFGTIEITGAGRGPWLTRDLLYITHKYVVSIGVRQVILRTSSDNEAAQRTLAALRAKVTWLCALRGPDEDELFCQIDVSSFGNILDGRLISPRTP